ncbi:MAG TPA: TetR family transcriptional regulator [Acidimicrobiales bacterium]|nr:TetR family transcriptional regulator [Acidimicrobiales bacterium]
MTRLAPNVRKEQILAAALRRAKVQGYNRVTREQIAADAGCAPGLVSNYFGTMVSLRRDIMRAAIRERVLPVIAQGLAAHDPHARKAPDELKQAALATLV